MHCVWRRRHPVSRCLLAAALLWCTLCLGSAVKAEETDAGLGWDDWNQGVLTLDLYSLPLSAEQRETLNQKIIKLRQDFGVGILGDVEQAISRLDDSNLAADATGVAKERDAKQAMIGKTGKFYDDLSLEEEILSLEFANKPAFDDPEGLKSGSQVDNSLYQKLLKQLEQLEQQKLREKVDDEQ